MAGELAAPPRAPLPAGDTVQKLDRERYEAASGRLRKDVLPLSPTRAPVPEEYWYTEHDAPVNHITRVTHAKMDERRRRK